MKPLWTEQAYLRLAEIYAFVASDSVDSAERLVDRLEHRAERLTRFPESGRHVPEFPFSEFREVLVGNYRLVYRVRGGHVEIVTVFEGHMLFPLEDIRSRDDPG